VTQAEAASPERRPTLRHRIEYVALRSFAGLVGLIGLRAGYVLADWVGSAIHAVDGRHRRVARSNLRQHFRDANGQPLPEREVRRIARDSFRHLVRSAVEIIHLPREIERRGVLDIISGGGREYVEAALAAKKGVFVITAHMGNWEVLGALCQELGVAFTSVYRPLDNPLLDRWVRSTRSAVGQKLVTKEGALRAIVSEIKSGGMVVLLVDQDARSHGIFAPFFGAPASTIPTPAELALRTGAAILTGTSRRVGPGFKHTGAFDPPIEVVNTGDREADVLRITTKINANLEAGIRLAPEQWLWSHRRWKTKPPAATGDAPAPAPPQR
jgi:KDO2-lipid IV(A) lauroyltransferase